MGLLNRIYALFNPETFLRGDRRTGAGIWRYNEEPDPDYVYIIKTSDGYMYDGGCAGYVFDDELTWDVCTFTRRQAARHQCGAGRVLRVKKSELPQKPVDKATSSC